MKVEYYVESALLSMLKQKPVAQIYVSGLIKEVGICKGTFYKYYRDKYDLLQKCFDNEYYGEILSHAETFEQFVGGCLSAFRKSPKIALNAMSPEDPDSLFPYNSRLAYEYIVKDRLRSGKPAAGKTVEFAMRHYAQSATRFMLDWLGASRQERTEDALELLRAVKPCVLSD